MASSNRHWPSMFKSKPYSSHHPWQPDINSTPHCQGPTYPSGSEERSPDPKPRWNPKPEQIRILEAIFNSGMVNPPRDEIRRIRVQLQEYGQVGDANVFYWFQNRKSRSKHKQRHHLHNSKHQLSSLAASTASAVLPSSSSSSSSEKSPPKRSTTTSATASASASASATNKLFNSPSGCINQNQNQNYLPSHHGDFLSDPFFYPMQLPPATGAGLFSQGLYVPEFSSNIVQVPDQAITPCGPGFLFSQLLNQTTNSSKKQQGQKKLKLGQQPQTYDIATTTCAATAAAQGGGMGVAGGAAAKTTVFINNVAVDVASGPFNVREAFGEEAVLIHSSTGQPMLTNQWGVTLQALQPGAFYYLV